MTLELCILWTMLALIALFVIGGMWPLFAAACRWIGRWLGEVFFGRQPGGRK